MEYLKPVFIILWNILPGFTTVWIIRLLLFNPEYEHHFPNGKKAPLTPGLIYWGKNWLIKKLTSLLEDYIYDTRNMDQESRISKWELTVYRKVWNKMEFISEIKFLPSSWKEKIRYFCAFIIYEITKQFFRSFIPYLMDHFAVRKYVELLDQKLDVDIIKTFYVKYIFKYMMLLSLAIALFISIWNIIIYLIIK